MAVIRSNLLDVPLRVVAVLPVCLMGLCAFLACDYLKTFEPSKLPKVTVTVPNGGELWHEGSTQRIEWTNTGRMETLDSIWYSVAGGTWTLVGSVQGPATGYSWLVPKNLTDEARIRVGAYVGDSSSIDESDGYFSIKVSYSLARVSALGTEGYACEIAINGSYAYVAVDSFLLTVNVSDPTAPSEVSRLALGRDVCVRSICVRDSLLFLGAWGTRLAVLDVSEPGTPTILSKLQLTRYYSGTGAVYGLVADSQYVYCNAYEKLWVVDISNPSAPESVAVTWPQGGAGGIWRMIKCGSYIYTMGQVGLHTFVVADPRTPRHLNTLYMSDWGGQTDIYGPYFHGAISGNDLYFSHGDLLKLDISNASAPAISSHVTEGTSIGGVAAQDSILCWGPLGQGTLELRVKSESASAPVAGPCLSVAIKGDYVFTALGDSGIAVYQIRK